MEGRERKGSVGREGEERECGKGGRGRGVWEGRERRGVWEGRERRGSVGREGEKRECEGREWGGSKGGKESVVMQCTADMGWFINVLNVYG